MNPPIRWLTLTLLLGFPFHPAVPFSRRGAGIRSWFQHLTRPSLATTTAFLPILRQVAFDALGRVLDGIRDPAVAFISLSARLPPSCRSGILSYPNWPIKDSALRILRRVAEQDPIAVQELNIPSSKVILRGQGVHGTVICREMSLGVFLGGRISHGPTLSRKHANHAAVMIRLAMIRHQVFPEVVFLGASAAFVGCADRYPAVLEAEIVLFNVGRLAGEADITRFLAASSASYES